MIAGVAEPRRREDQHALALDEARRELVNILSVQLRESDSSGARPVPGEEVAAARKKRVEVLEILTCDRVRTRENRVLRAQRNQCQHFTRRAAADRGVVLQPGDAT